MISAIQRGIKCVELLSDNGTVINMKDHDGCTDMMIASQFGDDDCLELVLDRGSDTNMKHDVG